MFRRSAGSLVGALLALLVVATAASAARARRIWFPKNRLPLAQPPGSVSGWGTPNLTPLMKDIDHGNTAPIQKG